MVPLAPQSLALPPSSVRVALDDPLIVRQLREKAQIRINRWLMDKSALQRQQETDDIVAETLSRALQKEADYDPAKGDVQGWLYGILRHVLSEQCRKLRKLPGTLPVNLHEQESTIEDFPSIDIPAMLKHLSPEDRIILESVVFEDRSHQQVSDKLGIRPGTCRQRLRRALTKLRHLTVEEDR